LLAVGLESREQTFFGCGHDVLLSFALEIDHHQAAHGGRRDPDADRRDAGRWGAEFSTP